jgi:hypothetical protein
MSFLKEKIYLQCPTFTGAIATVMGRSNTLGALPMSTMTLNLVGAVAPVMRRSNALGALPMSTMTLKLAGAVAPVMSRSNALDALNSYDANPSPLCVCVVLNAGLSANPSLIK